MTTALHQLSPVEFEQLVASLFVSQGFEDVQVIGGAGDLGVDIRCYDESANLVVVQCKRYAPNKRIGSPAIQHFMAMALHHGADRRIFVTTASYTPQAVSLAAAADVELVDGQDLMALVHSSQVVANYPDPSVPVVLPAFSDSGARYTFLHQLLPQTPIIQGTQLTDEHLRMVSAIRARLLALTPDELRKACILSYVARVGERDRPGIRLVENQNRRIKDYVVMLQPKPQVCRCHHLPIPGHHLPADQTVTAEDIDCFIRFAEADGYEPGSYSTTGMFTAEALLRTGVRMPDGWSLAHSFWWDSHASEGFHHRTDFINQARLPGWPKNLEEGTAKRGLIRTLFG